MSTIPSPALTGTRTWRRRLARLMAVVAVGYVGLILMLLALENRLLYAFPDTAEWVRPVDSRVQDIELPTADGTPVHAWWCPPKGWDPAQGALLYCHGNGGNLSRRSTPIASWQKELHTAVLIFDYPGYGRSEGVPSEAGCYAAADAAYDWLTQVSQVAPGRILIYGESLGGGVAVDLAGRRPHRGLILDSTFTSIPDMAQHQFPFVPARWLVRNRFDSLAKIGRCAGPVFIAHGTGDTLVPLAQAERLFAAAPEPKQFFAMPGCCHCQALAPQFFDRLRDFLSEAEADSATELSSR